MVWSGKFPKNYLLLGKQKSAWIDTFQWQSGNKAHDQELRRKYQSQTKACIKVRRSQQDVVNTEEGGSQVKLKPLPIFFRKNTEQILMEKLILFIN